MKRGYSNVQAEKTKPWHEVEKGVEPGIARIPISGGSSPFTTRELPPLSLRRDEWEKIGRKMGWLLVPRS